MQPCESQKPIHHQLLYDCHHNHHFKTSGLMYKKLQREHLLLQRSFASVCHSLNQTLSKCQSNQEFISNIVFNKNTKTKCQLKRQMSLINFKLLEDNEIAPTQQLNISSIPIIIHKKLCKEHVILQQSFATVCQSLREILERDGSQRPKHNISNSQQKKSNKKEFDELRRQIELLSIELQETRDQNELLEFRIHEFEQVKASPKIQASNNHFNGQPIDNSHGFNEISCNKCCELETQLFDVNNENQKLNEKLNATQKALNELIAKYALKEELNNLLLQRNYNKNTVIDKNSYTIGSAMTSEDEGLGDDTRRDHSSGPSSLADLHEPEYDAISEKSTQSTSELSDKEVSTDNCIANVERVRAEREQQPESVESDKEQHLRLEVMRSSDIIEKLKQSIEELKEGKANLEEQVLELEEAENDSRLMSQRLQQQMQTFVDDYEKLELELINANKTIDLNNNRIKSFETIETDLRHQIEEMRSILLKHYFVDNNCNRSEKRFERMETKRNVQQNNDLLNRIQVLDNKDKRSEHNSMCPQVDGLYSVVWEKLYRLENQIDCLRQSYSQTNQTHCTQDSDDDLQLFISAEKLSEGVSKIGCSFQVSHFDTTRDQTYNHCSASVRLDDLVLSMPLCEAVKPERIDVMVANQSQSKSTSLSHSLPPELMNKLSKLETNEQQLRERLVQLEFVNKEFVRELEMREKIFFERELNQSDWTNSENEFKHAINELKNQIKLFELKEHDLETQINNLSENIVSIYKNIEEKQSEHEMKLNEITNDRNNSLIGLKQHVIQLESKECEHKTQIESLDCQDIDSENNVKQVNEDFEQIRAELEKERDLISKTNEEFSTKIDTLVDYHKRCETNLKQEIQELESQKLNATKEMEIIFDKKIFLTNLLNDKENELKKVRNTYEKRMEILCEEHKLVEKELKMKMREMAGQTSSTVNQLEAERNKIIRQLDESFVQIKDKELEFTANINDLNEKVETIERKILRLVNNKSNFDELENERKKLKNEINSIQSCEEELKRKLNEMMQKESAYEETLSEADKIIATLEHNYKQRIDELEVSKTNLALRVAQLEESESRLRSSVRPDRPDRRANDCYGKASDLVKQLIDSEARECSLKQQIKTLEVSVNELQRQLDDTIHSKQRMESELFDQDELVETVNHLRQQIDSLQVVTHL